MCCNASFFTGEFSRFSSRRFVRPASAASPGPSTSVFGRLSVRRFTSGFNCPSALSESSVYPRSSLLQRTIEERRVMPTSLISVFRRLSSSSCGSFAKNAEFAIRNRSRLQRDPGDVPARHLNRCRRSSEATPRSPLRPCPPRIRRLPSRFASPLRGILNSTSHFGKTRTPARAPRDGRAAIAQVERTQALQIRPASPARHWSPCAIEAQLFEPGHPRDASSPASVTCGLQIQPPQFRQSRERAESPVGDPDVREIQLGEIRQLRTRF